MDGSTNQEDLPTTTVGSVNIAVKENARTDELLRDTAIDIRHETWTKEGRVYHLFFNPDSKSAVGGFLAEVNYGEGKGSPGFRFFAVPRKGHFEEIARWYNKSMYNADMETGAGSDTGLKYFFKKYNLEADDPIKFGSYSELYKLNPHLPQIEADTKVCLDMFRTAIADIRSDPILSYDPNIRDAIMQKIAETLVTFKMLGVGNPALETPTPTLPRG